MPEPKNPETGPDDTTENFGKPELADIADQLAKKIHDLDEPAREEPNNQDLGIFNEPRPIPQHHNTSDHADTATTSDKTPPAGHQHTKWETYKTRRATEPPPDIRTRDENAANGAIITGYILITTGTWIWQGPAAAIAAVGTATFITGIAALQNREHHANR